MFRCFMMIHDVCTSSQGGCPDLLLPEAVLARVEVTNEVSGP